MDELCLSCHLAVHENAFECGTCRKWVHYSCTQLPTYMIYQLAVILTDVEYKCEFCILSPGQVVSDKFMEIDLAISTLKSLGNGGLLNDSDTTDNNVDQPPPANDAPITNGDTGPPLEINVNQQDANPAPHLAAPIIQQQNVPQQTTIVQTEETLQHGLANSLNSLESTGDNGRQPPLLPPRPRATTVDTRIHNYRLSAAP